MRRAKGNWSNIKIRKNFRVAKKDIQSSRRIINKYERVEVEKFGNKLYRKQLINKMIKSHILSVGDMDRKSIMKKFKSLITADTSRKFKNRLKKFLATDKNMKEYGKDGDIKFQYLDTDSEKRISSGFRDESIYSESEDFDLDFPEERLDSLCDAAFNYIGSSEIHHVFEYRAYLARLIAHLLKLGYYEVEYMSDEFLYEELMKRR